MGIFLLGLISDTEQMLSVFIAFAFLALGVTSLCLGARSNMHRKDLIAVSVLFNVPFFVYLLSVLGHYLTSKG